MDVTGSSQKKKLFLFNGLKRSVDVLGNPWIDGVERAKGIEPFRLGFKLVQYVAFCGFDLRTYL